MKHITVLENETVAALNLKNDSVAVDCTLGSGGHARRILANLGPKGVFVGLDVDPTAIAALTTLSEEYSATVVLREANFRSVADVLQQESLSAVDAIMADLGWRIEQFDGSSGVARGFSFQLDEPLTMTFGNPSDYSFTAADILNEWAEEDIANVIFGYSEERFARRIANRVVKERAEAPFETSGQLVAAIKAAVPSWYRNGRTHPATRTFQALRIAVNDEFSALEEFIATAFSSLEVGGRLAIISFHSLEDRIVKHAFKALAHDQKAVLVNKKPITATDDELKQNPRSRSAKLRTIEKTQHD